MWWRHFRSNLTKIVNFYKNYSILTQNLKFLKNSYVLYFEENFVILKKIMHIWTHAQTFLKKIMSIFEGNCQFCTFLKKIWDFWNIFCRNFEMFVENLILLLRFVETRNIWLNLWEAISLNERHMTEQKNKQLLSNCLI